MIEFQEHAWSWLSGNVSFGAYQPGYRYEAVSGRDIVDIWFDYVPFENYEMYIADADNEVGEPIDCVFMRANALRWRDFNTMGSAWSKDQRPLSEFLVGLGYPSDFIRNVEAVTYGDITGNCIFLAHRLDWYNSRNSGLLTYLGRYSIK